ncbi:MAG: ATP-binding cassette domain-containing protein, partial [Pseudomonadota bacterium]|nr:ATP-binding cassette domain-containing protein [Pseudomonadota bacterium]
GGRATLDGGDLREHRSRDVRRVVGLLPQDVHIFNTSLLENVRLARPAASAEDIDQAAAAAGLLGWIRSLPEGWHTAAGERGSRMSGGQRQRLALARVFLARFPVLVLDEPLAQLDLEAANQLMTDILAGAGGAAVLVITHRLLGLEAMDEILVLADGRVVEANRRENTELLRGAVGGYGAIGVITEVELDLDDNSKIERDIEFVPLSDYPRFFADKVLNDRSSVMHNADLLPPRFDAPLAITWRRTDKPLTRRQRLVPRGQTYKLERNALWSLTELPLAGRLREPASDWARRARPEVAWRNHEASLDVASLEPYSRRLATYALDEFFVPPRHFDAFVREMGSILRRHRVAAVNVSIRHSPADTLALLPWAREAVFSFVLFYRQGVDLQAQRVVGEWTRELIDAALQHEGRYYLPYQLQATREQFERAYPEVVQLRQLKAVVDPQSHFSNALWQKYL